MLTLQSEELEPKHIKEVVKIHERAFQNFFLTILGTQFLKHFYNSLVEREDVIARGYWNSDNRLTGFFVANYNHEGFYRSLCKKNFFRFFFASLKTFLLRPMLLIRLANSYASNNKVRRYEKYAYLMSICVDPGVQNKGLGKLMLNDLVTILKNQGHRGVYLTTDADENSVSNSFYIRAGFVQKETIWQGKRKMNVYSRDFTES